MSNHRSQLSDEFLNLLRQPAFILTRQFMFPDAEDAPAASAQEAGDEAVAVGVAGEFLFPEGAVADGRGPVLRTAVPEAAVDEDRQAEFGEDEVRLDGGSRV